MTAQSYSRQFRTRQKRIEERYVGQIYTEVRRQFKSAVSSVRSDGVSYTRQHLDKIVNPAMMVPVLKKIYRGGAFLEANYQLSRLMSEGFRVKRMGGGDASFSLGFDEIAGVVDEYFKLYVFNKSAFPISETTKKYIVTHLLDEIDRGTELNTAITNFQELALSSGNGNSSLSRNRARTIVQTESLRALSFGGLMGAYMSGVDVDKSWVTSDDERVRGASRPARYPHTLLDNQTTSIFGAFVNGEQIKFPGDPDASADNTVNCRCSVFYKEKVKPKPRITTRLLRNFLSDFFIGFIINTAVTAVAGSLFEPEAVE